MCHYTQTAYQSIIPRRCKVITGPQNGLNTFMGHNDIDRHQEGVEAIQGASANLTARISSMSRACLYAKRHFISNEPLKKT